MLLELYVVHLQYIPNIGLVKLAVLRYLLTRFSQFDPCWPQLTLTSTKINRVLGLNVLHLPTQYGISTKLPFLRYCVNKVFTI